MTPEEKILAGDKLIAKFMGWKNSEHHKGYFEPPKEISSFITPMHIEDFKYHSSLDSLMPVREKAIKTGHCTIVMNNYDIALTTFSRPHEDDGFCKLYFHTSPNANNWTEIQALWNALVEFIEWHNQTI